MAKKLARFVISACEQSVTPNSMILDINIDLFNYNLGSPVGRLVIGWISKNKYSNDYPLDKRVDLIFPTVVIIYNKAKLSVTENNDVFFIKKSIERYFSAVLEISDDAVVVVLLIIDEGVELTKF